MTITVREGGPDDIPVIAEANGFTPTQTYTSGERNDWPGQVLARRV
ncbi:hypothetical protein ACVB8X_26430 [Streptomyces sp. NRAIS4]